MAANEGWQRLPLIPGAVAGIVAWLLGYLFTFILVGDTVRDSVVRRVIEFLGGDLPTWRVVGWIYYNAHFVSTNFDGAFAGSRNFIGGDGVTPVVYVVPPLVLFAAGLAVGRAAGVRDDLERAALVGLTVVSGYFVLSLVGVFVFAIDGAGPTVAEALLLAGILYPAVFGIVGAFVASRT